MVCLEEWSTQHLNKASSVECFSDKIAYGGGVQGGGNPPRWGCGGNATAYGVRPARSGRGGPGGSAPTKTVRPSEDKMRSNDLRTQGSNDLTTQGSYDLTTQGSNDLATQGSNDSATQGSNDSATQGSNDSATQGSNDSRVQRLNSERPKNGQNDSSAENSTKR